MSKYYVVVAGNGETSRANVEALVEDYVYANGKDVIFVLPYEKKPTAGQTFVSHWAKDKSKEIVIFANSDAKFDGMPSATLNESEDPFTDAVAFLDKKDKAVGFILWNDADPKSNQIVSAFNEKSVKCLDLTDGLSLIKMSGTVEEEPEPVIPQAEMLSAPKAPAPVEDDDDEEDDSDEWDEENESDDIYMEDVYFGMQAFIKAVAREVIRELDKRENDSKGPKA